MARCDDIPLGVTMALVICSNGCFQQAQVVRHLLQGHAMGVGVLPVNVDAAFRVPTEALHRDLRARAFDAGSDCGGRIVSFVTQLYEQIAVRMHPHNAMDVLDVRVIHIRERRRHLVWA